jgi:uncharacterized RDD family membrane protein YckC
MANVPNRVVQCPRCDADNHPDVRFCQKCDTPLGGGVVLPTRDLVLANRASRLLAKIIDAPFTVVSLLAASALQSVSPATEELQLALILMGVFGMMVQAALLSNDGQTIGKKLLKIKVVRADTERNGGFVTNVVLRAVVNGLLSLTGIYFVVDSAFILFRNRLCLHDYIAGTKVVRSAAHT